MFRDSNTGESLEMHDESGGQEPSDNGNESDEVNNADLANGLFVEMSMRHVKHRAGEETTEELLAFTNHSRSFVKIFLEQPNEPHVRFEPPVILLNGDGNSQAVTVVLTPDYDQTRAHMFRELRFRVAFGRTDEVFECGIEECTGAGSRMFMVVVRKGESERSFGRRTSIYDCDRAASRKASLEGRLSSRSSLAISTESLLMNVPSPTPSMTRRLTESFDDTKEYSVGDITIEDEIAASLPDDKDNFDLPSIQDVNAQEEAPVPAQTVTSPAVVFGPSDEMLFHESLHDAMIDLKDFGGRGDELHSDSCTSLREFGDDAPKDHLLSVAEAKRIFESATPTMSAAVGVETSWLCPDAACVQISRSMGDVGNVNMSAPCVDSVPDLSSTGSSESFRDPTTADEDSQDNVEGLPTKVLEQSCTSAYSRTTLFWAWYSGQKSLTVLLVLAVVVLLVACSLNQLLIVLFKELLSCAGRLRYLQHSHDTLHENLLFRWMCK